MAADERTSERVLREIKQAIVTGELRLRQRLDVETLARRFRVSATPVRQALAVLTAQRLVTIKEARGHYVAFWSERELKDLYEWRWRLAVLAVAAYVPAPLALAPARRRRHVEAYAAIMQHINVSANAEVRHAAALADERLSAALRAEEEALGGVNAEIADLIRALKPGGRDLQLALKRYFKRRMSNCQAIRARAHAQAMPRNGG